MSDLSIIVGLFANILGSLFTAFDSYYIDSWSLLDIFVALEYLSISLWGLFRLIDPKGSGTKFEE